MKVFSKYIVVTCILCNNMFCSICLHAHRHTYWIINAHIQGPIYVQCTYLSRLWMKHVGVTVYFLWSVIHVNKSTCAWYDVSCNSWADLIKLLKSTTIKKLRSFLYCHKYNLFNFLEKILESTLFTVGIFYHYQKQYKEITWVSN